LLPLKFQYVLPTVADATFNFTNQTVADKNKSYKLACSTLLVKKFLFMYEAGYEV
jgi:hypothetical protein